MMTPRLIGAHPHVAGGFSRHLGDPSKPIRRPKGNRSSDTIREAANAFLEKRSLLNEPNMQDSTAFGGWRGR